jgi:hypothetical protein
MYARINAPPSPEFKALGDAVRAAVARGELKGFFGTSRDDQATNNSDAANLAKQILAAGERARSDPSNERLEPGGLAGKILDAGRSAEFRLGTKTNERSRSHRCVGA